MLLGRILGWALIALTVLMASADAVMALGPADYSGILTADVITLLIGQPPEFIGERSVWAGIEASLMDMPAWTLVGAAGCVLLFVARKRHKRFRFRRSD